MAEQKSSTTRRTVVQGAAWSIPVIAFTAAAPAFAASPRCAVPISTRTATATAANLSSALPAVVMSVPAGARRMSFVVVGGQGGAGGLGARIEGDIAVAPGQSVGLIAGAGGEAYGSGRGGKSAYGNGGNGGSGGGVTGSGGGGASALTLAGSTIIVAGGGGGVHWNIGPLFETSPAGLYSSSLPQNFTARYGASSATSSGGSGNAGVTSPGYTGSTGMLGWMGQRTSTTTPPTSNQVVLMTGGGAGGGSAAPGNGGGPNWVSGPDFIVSSSLSGFPGSGSNGGNGVAGGAQGGAPGGGGGGYRGGGGGGAALAMWNQPPYPYNGLYGIASGGGGGSSYTNGSFSKLSSRNDTRTPAYTSAGNMGFVQVTFYPC